jgi:hypothetical protein
MAWGQKAASASDEWCARLSKNDPTFTSLTVLPFRPLLEGDVVALCTALHSNTRCVPHALCRTHVWHVTVSHKLPTLLLLLLFVNERVDFHMKRDGVETTVWARDRVATGHASLEYNTTRSPTTHMQHVFVGPRCSQEQHVAKARGLAVSASMSVGQRSQEHRVANGMDVSPFLLVCSPTTNHQPPTTNHQPPTTPLCECATVCASSTRREKH